jgi:phosphatidylserine decarboxylase
MVYDDGEVGPEKIVAEKWLRLLYGGEGAGSDSLLRLASRKALSRLYGMYCQTRHSARMIPGFIADNNVDMAGCAGGYKNFAEFFSREKKGVAFPKEPHLLGSPCEGLVSAYEGIDPKRLVAAKGMEYSLAELFGDGGLAEEYRGGACLRVRLTPANYHRMHFFDDGEITGVRCIDGDLYSVNPLAVAKVARLYCQNKRVLVQMATRHFGGVAVVEVGATFVGSVVHRFLVGDNMKRGRQASYFLPGGSLVLVYFKQGTARLDADILARTAEGIETKLPVGAVVGTG